MSWFLRAGVLGLLAQAAYAQPTRNIELSVYDPTPQTTGSSFQVQNADVGVDGDLVASAFVSYASKPLVLGTDANDMTVVRHHTMLSIGGAYAFANRFEAGARMPLYLQSGDAVPTGMTGVAPAEGTAAGDLTLHGKARFIRGAKLRLGAGVAVTLPTATDSEFAGTRLPTVRALILASLAPLDMMTIHVNAGGVVREKAEFANITQGSGVAWGAGVSLRILEKVFLDAEAFGDVIPSGAFSRPTGTNMTGPASTMMTVEWLAGARIHVTRQLSIGLAGGRGLTDGIGTPDMRGVLTLAFAPSARPLPPLHRPVVEAPVDPTKEDTDYDKLVDAVDKCKDQPEDKDGCQDDDGCPDPDNDGDGVLDAADQCATTLEDMDGFQDGDGCPDSDNDRDGVDDATDKCPEKPEKINGIDDNDGCPDSGDSLVISNPDRLELLESVTFTGTAVAKSSKNVLNQLATTLRARADIIRLRIGVHVQPTKNAKKDQQLSDRRANALKQWLINWGVEAERIEVRGFGSKQPLVPASTKGAAAINDRVELIILERN